MKNEILYCIYGDSDCRWTDIEIEEWKVDKNMSRIIAANDRDFLYVGGDTLYT